MSPYLEIKNLSVMYSNGHQALKDINLKITEAKIYGLVGINGAGKSTLFKSIMGFIKPNQGEIKIKGLDVKASLKSKLISYVPQTEEVDWDFPILVKDLVLMGRYSHMNFLRIPKSIDRKIVDESLERVGMLKYKERQIGELSGGQRKRIFVARSLAQKSQLILLDEPFTGVDIKTEDSLINLFKSLSKDGHLIITSTHNLGSVPRLCDEVILLNRELIAQGPVQSTFNQNNLSKTFGGKLRNFQVHGNQLHEDSDKRSINVLSDDEIPLIFYGEQNNQSIVKKKKDD